MGAMASKYQRLINILILTVFIVLMAVVCMNDSFHAAESSLILLSCICASVCLRLHLGKQRPESLVIIAAVLIFSIAYILQAVFFIINTHSNAVTASELISIRSIFSGEALSAGGDQITQSLLVVLIGFIGVLLPAVYLGIYNNRAENLRHADKFGEVRTKITVSNPLNIGYVAITITILVGLLRKYLGLDSSSPSGLPMGVGALINITSTYVGPNLLLAAIFFAFDSASDSKARILVVFSILLGLFNYFLFTSKLSLIFPVLYIVICQYLLQRQVISLKTIFVLAGVFLLVYPFLNLYRSAVALGVNPGDMVATITYLYENPNNADDIEKSVLQVAAGAIVGRFVGFDPLLILLQAAPYSGSLLEYLIYGDLDKYLTYTILDFQEGMGYSPGFLGRYFYISGSYTFLLISTALTVFIIAGLVRFFWRSNSRYFAPLLLSYCIVFFSDGIRLELIRALVFSGFVVYALLNIFAKKRVVSNQRN